MNDRWMKDLRRLGTAYERKAPDGLLGDIRRELSARGLEPAPPTGAAATPWRRKRMAVAAALAALAGTAVTVYLAWQTALQPGTARLHAPRAVTAATTTGTHAGTPRAEAAAPPHRSPRTTACPTTRQATEGAPPAAPQPRTGGDTPTPDAPAPERVGGSPHAGPEGRPAPPLYAHAASAAPKRSRQREWQLAAYCAGIPGNLSSDAPGASGGAPIMEAPASNAPAVRMFSHGPAPLMGSLPTLRHERHHRPVRVGLSVSLSLTPRWSLQAALTYSRLTSEFTEETPLSVTRTTQKLHYLGIPVSLCYRLWQHGHLSLYAKAGAGIEQPIGGKAVTHRTEGDATRPPVETRLSGRRPVWSTHAAMGAEYRPIRVLSLFAEGAAEYYFDNGSSLRSSYTDRPLHFSPGIGMRLHIR